MASSLYLTPPPTVPTTRHSSVTHPLHTSALALIDSSASVHSSPSFANAYLTAPSTIIPYIPLDSMSSADHLMNTDPSPPTSHLSVPRAHPYPLPPHSDLYNSPPLPLLHGAFPQPTKRITFRPSLTPASFAHLNAQYPHGPTISPVQLHPGIKNSRDDVDESPAPTSPNPRADKRRRTKKGVSTSDPDRADSPSMGSATGAGESPGSADPDAYLPQGQLQRRPSGLAPIMPIGFAAAREHRRESGGMAGEAALPSPVVMGFDFQGVDGEQLKTVRDTIGIKAQQEALIAQRRRDVAASTPNTPKELTFKGWQPKEQDRAPSSGAPVSGSGSGGVGRRRDKTRDKVERMSIVTAGGDKDGVLGSKSAPMNQNLSAQQSERGDPTSGASTGVPPHPNGLNDPRTAPMSNVRGSRADDGEFTRQQGAPTGGQYYRRYDPGHSHNRSVTDGGQRSSARIVTSSSRGGYNDRMPPPTAGGGGSRNGYQGGSGQTGGGGGSGHPGQGATYTSREHGSDSNSPSPPPHRNQPPLPTSGHSHGPPQMSARREAFLAPYNQLYDLLHQADSLRYNLQDLMVRYEGLYAGQQVAMQEFKGTAASSNTLLGNLQQSAESLKEMVRYEVGRSIAASATAGSSGTAEGDKKEVEELKERIKKLEERLDKKE